MKSLRKLALAIGLVALCACASHKMNSPDNPSPTPGDKVDCSTVRCAACPTGQHPVLRPPDCCRCVPD